MRPCEGSLGWLGDLRFKVCFGRLRLGLTGGLEVSAVLCGSLRDLKKSDFAHVLSCYVFHYSRLPGPIYPTIR
jgi:hypothetical protein